MGLFTRQPQEEDHGHGLLAEFEELVADIRDRVANRHNVVRGRLSALESESEVLSDLDQRVS